MAVAAISKRTIQVIPLLGFTQDWLDENGISLIYIPYTDGISSTEIKRRLKVE